MFAVCQTVVYFLYWTEFAQIFEILIRSSIQFAGTNIGGSTTFGTPTNPMFQATNLYVDSILSWMRGALDCWLLICDPVILLARLFAISGRLIVSVCGCRRKCFTFIRFAGLMYNF